LKGILLLALGVLLPALPAQAQRFSFAPTIGYTWPTPIFENTVVFPSTPGFLPGTEHQRLRVHPARVLGGRVGFALTPGWKLYAGGTRSATTALDWLDRVDLTVGFVSESRSFRSATFHTWELGAERLFHLATRFPTVGVKLGAGAYRFAISRNPIPCVVLPNTPPPGAVCPAADPWASHYNIVSAVAGLVVRQSLGSHVAMELEGKGSTGNANTSSFFVDLPPQLDQFEAPKTHRVNTTQISLGISVF
jgi:hypothetical protein